MSCHASSIQTLAVQDLVLSISHRGAIINRSKNCLKGCLQSPYQFSKQMLPEPHHFFTLIRSYRNSIQRLTRCITKGYYCCATSNLAACQWREMEKSELGEECGSAITSRCMTHSSFHSLFSFHPINDISFAGSVCSPVH